MNQYRVKEPPRFRAMDLATWTRAALLPSDAFIVFMTCWNSRLSTAQGIAVIPDGYLVCDLQRADAAWTLDRLARAWAILIEADLLWRDKELIILPTFVFANGPCNKNMVVGWRRVVRALPDSTLFAKLYERAAEWFTREGLSWLSEKVPASYLDTISKQFPNSFETVGEGFRNTGSRDPGIQESRVQGAGSREQGVQGGERRGKNPDGAPGGNPDGEPVPAFERSGRNGVARKATVEETLIKKKTRYAYSDDELERERAALTAVEGRN